ncbi:MAG: tetratricopeptide repeat protein [Xanthobacteraceae bacterium]|nr:tetratricopeptide repeat protein [Xanthobacteraceae bacterium]
MLNSRVLAALVVGASASGLSAPVGAESSGQAGPFAEFSKVMSARGVVEAAPHFSVYRLCSNCRETAFYCTIQTGKASDLKGKHIRVSIVDNELVRELRALGANPVPVPNDQVVTALRRGVINCVSYVPPPTAVAKRDPTPPAPSEEDRTALAELDEAIRRDATSASPYRDRAMLYERMGRKAEAVADYRKALLLDPADRQAAEGLQRLGAKPF